MEKKISNMKDLMLRRAWRWLQFGWNREQRDRELDEELTFHLEQEAAEREEAGLAPMEARRQARLDLGNPAVVKETTRETWGWTTLESCVGDLRYGLRSLANNPAFAVTAVLSLALGIGANAAIYGIIEAVMLRTLPVEDPQQLVQLAFDGGQNHFTNPLWEAIRDTDDAFAGTLAFGAEKFDLSDGGESRFADGLWVSGDYFYVLGVPALRGRVFDTQDDQHGCGADGPVAVISYDFWRTEFQARPEAVGGTVRLNRQPFKIVGVTPPWMKGLDRDRPFDVAIPIGCELLLRPDENSLEARNWWWLRILGRLRPDATVAQTRDRLNALAPNIVAATTPEKWSPDRQASYRERRFDLVSAATGFSVTGRHYRTALYTLMAVVGLVLLIACANIANLLLARAAARRRELSMRMAIGASRGRVIRQLLTESLALAGLGAAAGFLVAIWGARLLVQLISTTGNPVEIDLSPNLHLIGFTAGIAAITALIFGLAPACDATRFGLNQALKEHGRGAVRGASRFRLSKGVAAVQIAISFVLLLAAGLFTGTLRNLLAIDAGFEPEGVLLVNVKVQQAAVERPQRLGLYQEILDRLRGAPGVTTAATSALTPISGRVWNTLVEPEGYQAQAESDALMYLNSVSPDYFQTMGTPLLAGRDFNDHDDPSAPLAMVINELAARRFFGSDNPVGKTIRLRKPGDELSPPHHVIGVVADSKYYAIDENTPPTGFLAMAQDASPSASLHYAVRYTGSLEALTPGLRAAIAKVNPEISLEFRSFETQVEESLRQPRVVALLSAAFGGLALLLAMVGLYGVTSHSVARRKGEIGVRMALGARSVSVLWLVMRDVIALLAAGTLAGVLASLAAGRLVTSLLFGVEPNDPTHFLVAAATLAGAVALAAYIPARRAAGLQPMVVLREE